MRLHEKFPLLKNELSGVTKISTEGLKFPTKRMNDLVPEYNIYIYIYTPLVFPFEYLMSRGKFYLFKKPSFSLFAAGFKSRLFSRS